MLLRQAGYDVASMTEDLPGKEDPEVLTRATNEQRVILTFDRDYGEPIYRLRLPSPRYDGEEEYIWLITYWKSTRRKRKIYEQYFY